MLPQASARDLCTPPLLQPRPNFEGFPGNSSVVLGCFDKMHLRGAAVARMTSVTGFSVAGGAEDESDLADELGTPEKDPGRNCSCIRNVCVNFTMRNTIVHIVQSPALALRQVLHIRLKLNCRR